MCGALGVNHGCNWSPVRYEPLVTKAWVCAPPSSQGLQSFPNFVAATPGYNSMRQ